MNLLAVDVGNTATNIGVFKIRPGSSLPRPQLSFACSTRDIEVPSLVSLLKNRLKKTAVTPVAGVHVSSVVPDVDRKIQTAMIRLFSLPPTFVSAKNSGKIKVRYKVPSEVGADRIVNARAAMEVFSGPAIVIDFGTATTFDCVTGKGEYLGGVIAPGPVISAEALYQRTAKLPLVLLNKPAQILGRNTLESIQAGLYHGYRGLVKEITARLKTKMGPRTKVLATGGQAGWILQGISVVDRHLPDLTLQGLYHLWMDSHVLNKLRHHPKKEAA